MRSNTESEVFKVDRRGRVHVSAARREELVEEFERSGVSAPEFARLVGVKYATFAGWRAKRRGAARRTGVVAGPAPDGQAETPAVVQLFEAVVETSAARSGEGLVVELPAGRLRITASAQLPWAAELLRLLGQPGGRPC